MPRQIRVRVGKSGGPALATRLGHNISDPARNAEIDLALAIMCALQRPGETFTNRTIGEVTGMSHGGASHIEKAALRKLRRRLSLLRQLSA